MNAIANELLKMALKEDDAAAGQCQSIEGWRMWAYGAAPEAQLGDIMMAWELYCNHHDDDHDPNI